VILELPFWPTPSQALALIMSPRLGLLHYEGVTSIFLGTKFNIFFQKTAILPCIVNLK
jgi:hypothetical protein